MKELQPVNQHVLLDISEKKEEQKTAGGIIIPDSVKDRPDVGTVVGLASISDAEIAVGEKVLFKQFTGTETELEGKKYLLIPYSEILAKIVETEAI
ncbi:MAG: co-chaperone GroES [Bacteroidales bacterium]|jgi:chaperonin GroES